MLDGGEDGYVACAFTSSLKERIATVAHFIVSSVHEDERAVQASLSHDISLEDPGRVIPMLDIIDHDRAFAGP